MSRHRLGETHKQLCMCGDICNDFDAQLHTRMCLEY